VHVQHLHAGASVCDASAAPEECGVSEDAIVQFLHDVTELLEDKGWFEVAMWALAVGVSAERCRREGVS
jgi:hypothetical protein